MSKSLWDALISFPDHDSDTAPERPPQWTRLEDSPNPFLKCRKHKPAHKDLEAYSSDGEADEDGFFDEEIL